MSTNVLLYVMDALRPDHLSCYGYGRETTPVVDELAADGVRYTNCFSTATWTKPASASVLTGMNPPVHGVRTREDAFNSAVPRLPEPFAEAGIRTAGFSTMGNVSASLGYDTGFHTYNDLYKNPEIVAKRRTTDAEAEELDHEEISEVAIPRASDLTERLTDWLAETSDPFFAFAWSVEPHIPYDPPERFRMYVDESYDGPVDGSRECLPAVDGTDDLEHLRALYDGEIRYNDEQLGEIVTDLQHRGLYDETLIVVLGDHGDAFREHGQLTHGNLPYDEVLRVPLVIKPPAAHGTSGETVDEICSLVDVAPTIAEAAGADWHAHVQGRVLPPWGTEGSSTPVFSETRSRDIYPAYYSVRTEDSKYMYVDSPERTVRTLAATAKQLLQQGLLWDVLRHPLYYYDRYNEGVGEYLFDLTEDPEERDNLAEDRPEVAAEWHERIESWIDRCEQLGEQFGDETGGRVDEATSEQLRRLGYVD